MKGQLVIDFEISPTHGRNLVVSGQIQTPRGPMDIAQDTMFCAGLLEAAKEGLWARERAGTTITQEPKIEVPVGIDGKALRALGR